MKLDKILFLTQTAFFGIIAVIVKLFEVPIFFIPEFYKLDFGEAIVLMGGFLLGPVAGIMIELIKLILFFIFKGTSTFFIGEIANFVFGCALILPSCIIYKRNRTLEGAIHGMVLGIISLTIVSGIINYFLLLPIYSMALGLPKQSLIYIAHLVNPHINDTFTFTVFAVLPFNFIKGIVSCFTAIVLYKKMSRMIEKLTLKTRY